MKEGWKEVRLGDITEKLPKSNHPAKDALESGDYLFFTNSASEKKFYINDYDYDEPIILANTGGRAYFKYCDTKCSASRDLYIIRCTENINTKLIYYILMQRVEEINENGFAGAALKHLNKHYLNDLKIMIPESKEEQDKLVNLFDSLGDLVEAHSAKADVLSRMKEHLMDNKSGIIEKERSRSEFDRELLNLQSEVEKHIKINFSDVNSNNLDIRIRLHRDNLDKINYIVELITYIGEDKHYERESLTPGIEWETVKLKDIIKITSGEFIRKDLQDPNGQYKVYNGGTSYTGCYDKFNVKGPKVIISSRGTAGFVNKVTEDFWAGNSCYVMNILDEDRVDFDYLYYILKFNQERLQGQTQSGTIPAVNMSQVYDLDISLPVKMSDQKRIAKVLSDLDRLQELHGLKVQELCKMKDHLMDNKSGIIEKERNRNAIDLRILELSNKLGMSFNNTSSSDIDTRIKLHKESLKNINYKIEVITYVGENEHYDREREFNPRYSLGNI